MTQGAGLSGLEGVSNTREITRSTAYAVVKGGAGHRAVQVALDTLMVGNLAEKSLALTAIFTATWRATVL